MGVKAHGADGLGKQGRYLPVAVDDEHMLGLGLLEVGDPVQQMIPVGVGAETLEVDDLGPDGHILAEQLHAGRAVQQGAAQGAGGLEAHEHHGAVGTPQVVLQVVADTARVAHTAGGDDDLGDMIHIQQLGFLHRLRQMQAREVEHMGAVLHQGQRLLVQIAPQIAAEDAGGGLGQGRIHIHREVLYGGHQMAVLDLPDEVQQLLGTAHGEGGDHHVAALAQRLVDDLGQIVGIAPHLGVVAVAVGALHHHIVRPAEELGIPDDGLIHIADIAGEHDVPLLAALGQLHQDGGAAQQVARVDEGGLHALAHVHGLVIFAGLQKFRHPHGIRHGIQRLHVGAARTLVLAVLILGVALLNVGGVRQHDIQQVGRQPGGDDLPLEAVLDQHGDPAGVVDMGVSHQHRVDAAGMEGQRGVVHLVPSLLQATVDENMLSVYLQTMAAAGDALVSAEKAQLHGVHPFQKVHSFVSHFCYDRCYSIVSLFSAIGKPELAIGYGSSNFLCIYGIDMVY